MCLLRILSVVFFRATATTEIDTCGRTLPLHDALPISEVGHRLVALRQEAGEARVHMRHAGADLEVDLDSVGRKCGREFERVVEQDLDRADLDQRSEERRVGKEGVSTLSSRWWTYH